MQRVPTQLGRRFLEIHGRQRLWSPVPSWSSAKPTHCALCCLPSRHLRPSRICLLLAMPGGIFQRQDWPIAVRGLRRQDLFTQDWCQSLHSMSRRTLPGHHRWFPVLTVRGGIRKRQGPGCVQAMQAWNLQSQGRRHLLTLRQRNCQSLCGSLILHGVPAGPVRQRQG